MTLENLVDQTAIGPIQYAYDFGNDRDHGIRIERVDEAVPGMSVRGHRRRAGLLEALADAREG